MPQASIPVHLEVKPDLQGAARLRSFVIGGPIRSLLCGWFQFAHETQLPRWIYELDPSSYLCRKARQTRKRTRRLCPIMLSDIHHQKNGTARANKKLRLHFDLIVKLQIIKLAHRLAAKKREWFTIVEGDSDVSWLD